jgi:hypothetical protein
MLSRQQSCNNGLARRNVISSAPMQNHTMPVHQRALAAAASAADVGASVAYRQQSNCIAVCSTVMHLSVYWPLS